jgi:DNA-nicking Smr family endonuclease
MDFGKILDTWEKKQKKASPVQVKTEAVWAREVDKYWDSYDKGPEFEESVPGQRGRKGREALQAMRPQAALDLHGMTVEEARCAMRDFLNEARRRGLKKLLIIHGKGNHSKDGPVLKREVSLFLEKSSITGKTGTPPAKWGGSGATWVLLKTDEERRGYLSR